MAFREKRAWAALVTLMLIYGAYFLLAPKGVAAGPADIMTRLIWFAAATLGWGIAYGLALSTIAARTPPQDRAAADERDRAIEGQAAKTAYYVLMALMVLVGIVMPFNSQDWEIVNAALLGIVLAEALRHTLIVIGYRRGGAHG